MNKYKISPDVIRYTLNQLKKSYSITRVNFREGIFYIGHCMFYKFNFNRMMVESISRWDIDNPQILYSISRDFDNPDIWLCNDSFWGSENPDFNGDYITPEIAELYDNAKPIE